MVRIHAIADSFARMGADDRQIADIQRHTWGRKCDSIYLTGVFHEQIGCVYVVTRAYYPLVHISARRSVLLLMCSTIPGYTCIGVLFGREKFSHFSSTQQVELTVCVMC